MASKEDLNEFDRKAKGKFTAPIPPFPKIPEALKQKPEYKKAWTQFEKEVDDWRKNIKNQPAEQTATAVVKAEGPGGKGDKGDKGDPGPAGQPGIDGVTTIITSSSDASTTATGIKRKIWVALRTDGQNGTGKLSDPFNGLGPDRFDALMRSSEVTDNTEINLLPGDFLTRGWTPTRDAISWRLRPGCKLRGDGIGITILRLVEANVAGGFYEVVLSGPTGTAEDAFWNPAGGYSNDVEVSDMTIDLDYAGQPNQPTPTIQTNAVQLCGSRTRISRVRAIHFGQNNGLELFVLGIGAPDPAFGPMNDVVIEDCIVELPVWVNNALGGGTMIHLFQKEVAPGIQEFMYNGVVRGCSVDCTYTDGFVPYITSDVAYPAGRNPMIGIGLGSGYDMLIEGNNIRNGARGPYLDTWSSKFYKVRNNRCYNTDQGFTLAMGQSSPYTGQLFTAEQYVVEDNEITLRLSTGLLNATLGRGLSVIVAPEPAPGTYLVREAIFRRNLIHLIDNNMNVANWVSAGIVVMYTENLLIEDNLIRLPQCQATPRAQGSIWVRHCKQLVSRNNRRPEDNSLISPYIQNQNRFSSDLHYEAEKALLLSL